MPVPALPVEGHATRNVIFNRDLSKMYVAVGSDTNVQRGLSTLFALSPAVRHRTRERKLGMGSNSAAKSNGEGRLGRAADAVKRLLSGPARREPDVPLDVLQREYIPPLTSSKTSFRNNGADHQRDQDAVAADRWNDEDHFTNKSGDPRIGTHQRTYEPNETRAESRE